MLTYIKIRYSNNDRGYLDSQNKLLKLATTDPRYLMRLHDNDVLCRLAQSLDLTSCYNYVHAVIAFEFNFTSVQIQAISSYLDCLFKCLQRKYEPGEKQDLLDQLYANVIYVSNIAANSNSDTSALSKEACSLLCFTSNDAYLIYPREYGNNQNAVLLNAVWYAFYKNELPINMRLTTNRFLHEDEQYSEKVNLSQLNISDFTGRLSSYHTQLEKSDFKCDRDYYNAAYAGVTLTFQGAPSKTQPIILTTTPFTSSQGSCLCLDSEDDLTLPQLRFIHDAVCSTKCLDYNLPCLVISQAFFHNPADLSGVDMLEKIFMLMSGGIVIFNCDFSFISNISNMPQICSLIRLYQRRVQFIFTCIPDHDIGVDPDTIKIMLYKQGIVCATPSILKYSTEYLLRYGEDHEYENDLWALAVTQYQQERFMTLSQLNDCYEMLLLDDKSYVSNKYYHHDDPNTNVSEHEFDIAKGIIQNALNHKNLEYSPLVKWTSILEKYYPQQGRAIRNFQIYLNKMTRDTKVLSNKHILITGGKGTGKDTYARLFANAIRGAGLTDISMNRIEVYSTAFIRGYQGQTTAAIQEFFHPEKFDKNTANPAGSVVIIHDIDTLLYENDYGKQALIELANQLNACDSNTVIILTCKDTELHNLEHKEPRLLSATGTHIHLDEYDSADIQSIISAKLKQSNLSLNTNNISTAIIQRAFKMLRRKEDEYRNSDPSTLKFHMHSDVHLQDVIGNKSAKGELSIIAENISNDSYIPPKGILLYGPSGVGKTLLAQAFAADAHIPFCNVPISYFKDADSVKTLFIEASKFGKCAIFIDELEAILPSREAIAYNPILNQMLQELDGFVKHTGIIVIGATNHVDKIDSAILRPGRFDRKIFLEAPNATEREELLSLYLSKLNQTPIDTKYPDFTNVADAFQYHLADYVYTSTGSKLDSTFPIGLLLDNGHFAERVVCAIKDSCYALDDEESIVAKTTSYELDPQLNCAETIQRIAEQLAGATGADISIILKRAANLSVINKCIITEALILQAAKEVLETGESSAIFTEKEKERTAYHEAGHAIVSLFYPDTRVEDSSTDLTRVTIIASENAYGITAMNNSHAYTTKSSLERHIAICFGGRLAEELIYGKDNVSTGCSSDMQSAYDTAKGYVVQFGFGSIASLSLLGTNLKTCSDSMRRQAESEITKVISQSMRQAKSILEQHQDELNLLTTELLSKQELTGVEVRNLLNLTA